MEIISNCTEDVIKKAARALKDGNLVAFPTETVYGLGADAMSKKAVSRIYQVKGRPVDHPLIVHISSRNLIHNWSIEIPEFALKLAEEFWPGPLTLILKRSDLAKDFITGGQDKVGVRVPAQPVALGLLREFEKLGGMGIAAPSANRFGAVSPTTAVATQEEIGAYLGAGDLILDGSKCAVGIESTIIDCTSSHPTVLRPGSITLEMIKNFTGIKLSHHMGQTKASGLLESHYSPKARVFLFGNAEPGDGFIAMADVPTPEGAVRLAAPKNVEQFAHELYEALRNGDRANLSSIIVNLPEGGGLAESIRDRLVKSSHQIRS